MNYMLLNKLLGSAILFNCCFAEIYGYESGRDIQDKYCWYMDDFAKKDDETSCHVHQHAPKRPGFENPEEPIRSTSQTFGDTTYHTYYPPGPRKGFAN